MIFGLNKYNYKSKIIIKIYKLINKNQMFGLRIFYQTKFENLKFEISKIILLNYYFLIEKFFIKIIL